MARLSIRMFGRGRGKLPPRDAQARLEALMDAAIRNSTAIGRGLYMAAINRRTGRTASTIGSTVLGGGSHVEGHFGSSDLIAWILEFGSRPHRITARSGGALHWAGARHPVRYVNHPGTRPYLPLTRVAPKAGDVAKAQLRAAFAAVFG